MSDLVVKSLFDKFLGDIYFIGSIFRDRIERYIILYVSIWVVYLII